MVVHAVIPESFVDGLGIRSVLFFQGCPHNCVGCHNPGTHAYDSVDAVNISVDEFLRGFEMNKYLAGVTFSGGEPFSARNLPELCQVAERVHALGKSVWAFTGYTLPRLLSYLNSLPLLQDGKSNVEVVLGHIDVLVDGPFCVECRDTSLRFRGSSNQRVISVQAFLTEYRDGLFDQEIESLIARCIVEDCA